MNVVYVHVMAVLRARVLLGVARSLVGLTSWSAPDRTVQFFGITPAKSDRFVTRLFGCRDLALGVGLLTAPAPAVPTVATWGVAVDVIDAVAGFHEATRGNLSPRAVVLGPGGAVAFAVLGVLTRRQESVVTAS